VAGNNAWGAWMTDLVLARFSAAGGVGWAAGAAVGAAALSWLPPAFSVDRWTSLHAFFPAMALVRAAAATRLEERLSRPATA